MCDNNKCDNCKCKSSEDSSKREEPTVSFGEDELAMVEDKNDKK